MTTTKKLPHDATRALIDVTGLPPQVFTIPTDSKTRKAKHLQRTRKDVAVQLARRSDADGTNAFPSVQTIATATGCSARTVFNALEDLRTLKVLTDGEIHGHHKTRIRSLDIAALMKLAGSPVQDSKAPVQDRQDDPCRIDAAPVQDSQAPVQNRKPPVQDRPSPVQDSYCTQPPYNRPSNQTKLTAHSDRGAGVDVSGASPDKPATGKPDIFAQVRAELYGGAA